MDDRGFINDTPFAAQELYLADEEGRDLLAIVVRATYEMNAEGTLTLADEQPPVEVSGVYHGEPGESSFRYEPEVASLKLGTDVVLIGHAYADRANATSVEVRFRVGPVGKVARVFGDRRWYRRMGAEVFSDPLPFEKMPLVYERAFGGWDRTAADPALHTVEARNPIGVGYHDKKHGAFVEEVPLPNLEDPEHLIAGYFDTPPPAGFGFIGPGWMPRMRFAGTYDDAWMQNQMPLLPLDFDRRFYNAATPGLIVPGYLRGNEPVHIMNAVPEGRMQFHLPGEPAPRWSVVLKDRSLHTSPTTLDTVIVDTDEARVTLIWRANMLVPGGRLHDIRAIRVEPHPGSVHALPSHTTVSTT